MALHLFPPDDPKTRKRLRRQLMGLLSYLMFVLPIGYAVEHGWMRFGWDGLAWFTLAALVLNIGFFVTIRSGYSKRFADPGMTLPQIAGAMLLALGLVHYADEARDVLLLLFVSSLFFGVFGLSTRQFLALTATAVGGYALLMLFEFHGTPLDDPALRLELLRFLTLTMILLWLSLLGSYVAGLRRRLTLRTHELATAMARLTELVSHDELTGVFNRRHLMDILGREKERADRFGHSFSVCILDLDHFKRINDEHGHPVGDEVLRGFSERMRRCARKMDWLGRQEASEPTSDTTFGRYGGEEFLLVLPHTPIHGAKICVERLRALVQAEPITTTVGPIALSFSAGLAEHRAGEPVGVTLSRADAALYRAKAGGRARTEMIE
jgi:diguanylate cyclase